MTSKTKFTLIVVGLLASLAINIFGLGLLAGHHFGPPGFIDGPPPAGPHGMLAHMERVLSPDDARIFGEEMRRGLPQPDKNPAMIASFKALHDALTAADFSPATFQQALQRVHDQHSEMDKGFVQAFTSAVTKISPEGRYRLAQALPDHPPSPEDDR